MPSPPTSSLRESFAISVATLQARREDIANGAVFVYGGDYSLGFERKKIGTLDLDLTIAYLKHLIEDERPLRNESTEARAAHLDDWKNGHHA